MCDGTPLAWHRQVSERPSRRLWRRCAVVAVQEYTLSGGSFAAKRRHTSSHRWPDDPGAAVFARAWRRSAGHRPGQRYRRGELPGDPTGVLSVRRALLQRPVGDAACRADRHRQDVRSAAHASGGAADGGFPGIIRDPYAARFEGGQRRVLAFGRVVRRGAAARHDAADSPAAGHRRRHPVREHAA